MRRARCRSAPSRGAPPGRLAPDAPLAFTLDAELATLTPLQPWLGTAAVVNGSARIALSGHGTFAAPVFSGTVAGDALRIDAPQYGVYLRDGRVCAHIADGGIAVDEISIAGGAGRFTRVGNDRRARWQRGHAADRNRMACRRFPRHQST